MIFCIHKWLRNLKKSIQNKKKAHLSMKERSNPETVEIFSVQNFRATIPSCNQWFHKKSKFQYTKNFGFWVPSHTLNIASTKNWQECFLVRQVTTNPNPSRNFQYHRYLALKSIFWLWLLVQCLQISLKVKSSISLGSEWSRDTTLQISSKSVQN